jgi:hypothetical protein
MADAVIDPDTEPLPNRANPAVRGPAALPIRFEAKPRLS